VLLTDIVIVLLGVNKYFWIWIALLVFLFAQEKMSMAKYDVYLL